MYNPYLFQYQSSPYQQPMLPANRVPGAGLNQAVCEMISDYETVKAAQIDFNGQPKFYAMTDGTTVYKKQLMPNGTSGIFKYVLLPEEQAKEPESLNQSVNDSLAEMKDRINDMAEKLDKMNLLWGGAEDD